MSIITTGYSKNKSCLTRNNNNNKKKFTYLDQSVFLTPNSSESQQEAAPLGELWHTQDISALILRKSKIL